MKKLLLYVLSIFTLCGCSSNASQSSENTNPIPIDPGNNNVLVAYFSVTNNTKRIAGLAKEHLDSDIFEIVPSEPYTNEDIDYNSDCRANREQNNESCRPSIAYKLEDISKYDTIVLGYPIWWGQAPKILYTFVESYDLSNKTILPFCTSGSSSIGSSATNLAKSAPNAKWLEGRRFASNASNEEVNNWLDQYFKKDETMKLEIDEKELNVDWLDNPSVKALNEIKPLEIKMSLFGGFEQVGPIGQSIVSSDVQMTTSPGDIVLYSSDQIVVFFGTNSWRYTKLGHINLNQNELNELLNKESVTLKIK